MATSFMTRRRCLLLCCLALGTLATTAMAKVTVETTTKATAEDTVEDDVEATAEQSAQEPPSENKSHPYPLAVTGPKPAEITPPSEAEIAESIERGIDFLLAAQRSNGSWGGPYKTKQLNIFAPIPGAHHAFRMGTSSLAIEGLCETRHLTDGKRREQVEAALDKAQAWILKHGSHLRRAEQEALYNVWGHSFGCHGLVALHRRAEGKPEVQAKLIEALQYQVDRLKRYTFINGGWGYYDFGAHTKTPSGSPTSFTTATGLIALKRAASLGVAYPEKLADKAVASILRQRNPDFSYAYGEYLRMAPRYGINRPAGSLGRSQACNLALRQYGRDEVTDEVIKTWLDRLFARNGWLSIGRKYPVPHESHFGVAGYFYYYGHYYAGFCLDELKPQDRPHFQQHLAHILIPLQEKDGSWWDYPLYDYHQSAGTGMTLTALVRCLPNQGK